MNYINARDFGASGSSFETVGHTVAGSDRIVLDDIGDFEVGQQIKMSDVFPRCTCFCYFDPPPSRKITRQAGNEVEFRGWDGSNGDHVVYYLDIDPANTSVCRWSDDQGRSWHNDVASLRVFMATLRKKLEPTPDSPQVIQTHIGVGYRMMKIE